jgi:O-antigen/teichoic acid export membrane protein
MHRRLTLNASSNFLRYAVSIVVSFYLTPFIVRTLGDAQYGFWVLLGSFLGYASILEIGVQPAVVKLVGQYKAVENLVKLRELITAAFLFFLAVGTIAALFCLTVVPMLVEHHVQGLNGLADSRLLYLAIALDAVLIYMNYLVTGILYGYQRYHLRNAIDVAAVGVNAALIFLLLNRHGLLAVVISKIAMDLLVVLVGGIAIRVRIPELTLDFGRLQRTSFFELLHFGGRVFISSTTTRIATLAQPVIISSAISATATAFYAIPVRLVEYARQITWTLTASFMPAFSELQSRDERETLRRIYLDFSRYFFLILLPIVALLFVYGAPFIGLWIGPEYEAQGRMVLWLLTGSVFVESFHPLMWRFFIGVGELDVLVRVSAVVSLLVVVSGAVLAKLAGLPGVAASVFVGAVVAQSIYARQAARYLQMSSWAMFCQVHLRPLLGGLGLILVAAALAQLLGSDSYAAMALGSILALPIYAAIAVATAVTPAERAQLFRWLRLRAA